MEDADINNGEESDLECTVAAFRESKSYKSPEIKFRKEANQDNSMILQWERPCAPTIRLQTWVCMYGADNSMQQ